MTHTSTMPALLVALCLAGCTTASETEVAALGAALGNVPLALPKLPRPKPKFPQPLPQLCPDKPDLAAQTQTFNNFGYKDWLYVCTPVKNIGGGQWTSNASQISVRASSSVSGSGAANAGGIASLASGATVNKCGWVKVPGLLRLGHHTPEWGECKATMNITSQFMFDPDIRQDGNTSNDDCLATNNKRVTAVDYMLACPW